MKRHAGRARTRPFRTWPIWLSVLTGILVACEMSLGSITVEVQTDLVPQLELGLLEVEVLEGAVPSGSGASRSRRTAAMPQLSEAGEYQRGRRVAEIGALGNGTYTVRVVGRRPAPPGAPEDSGTILSERRVVVMLAASRTVRVVLDASCVGVTCPGVGDSPDASQCLNGRCVAPTCDPSASSARRQCCTGSGCPETALCVGASECVVSPCAQARCVDGVCIAGDRPGACTDGEYCDRSARACLPVPGVLRADAGAPDARFDARPDDALVLLDAFVEPGEDTEMFDAFVCPREQCGDGDDDDCDGLLDCDDPDCGGTACDDSDPCTHSDSCVAGRCAGVPVACETTECVTRACNGSASCTETPRAGTCAEDGNPCTGDVCAAGRCTHPPRADGSTCGAGRCCGGDCVDVRSSERHCGVCGVDCGARACVAGACRCGSNTDCVTSGYGSTATCFDQGDGNGLRCQCVCRADSAWRGVCDECPGAAQCEQRSGLNLCFFP